MSKAPFATFEVRINSRPAEKGWAKRHMLRFQREEIIAEGERALAEYMDRVNAKMGRLHSSPYTQGAQAGGLQRRSGKALEGLTQHEMKRIPGGAEASIAVPGYLKAHEYGMTIRAKARKYLAVPLPAALNPDGTPKRPRPWDWKGAFVIKSRRGNLLIVRRVGSGYENLYALKEYVRIPGVLKMRENMLREFPMLAIRIEQQIRKVLSQDID